MYSCLSTVYLTYTCTLDIYHVNNLPVILSQCYDQQMCVLVSDPNQQSEPIYDYLVIVVCLCYQDDELPKEINNALHSNNIILFTIVHASTCTLYNRTSNIGPLTMEITS